jgi:hypothetical protein
MSKEDYIKQFIKDYGHAFGMGFYIELHTGTDEYDVYNVKNYR